MNPFFTATAYREPDHESNMIDWCELNMDLERQIRDAGMDGDDYSRITDPTMKVVSKYECIALSLTAIVARKNIQDCQLYDCVWHINHPDKRWFSAFHREGSLVDGIDNMRYTEWMFEEAQYAMGDGVVCRNLYRRVK